MKCFKICTLVFVCSLFAACKGKYTTNETILRAEAILNSKPDSAQKILLSISHPEQQLSQSDYASWCLLYTHTQYRLYQDIKSDSLIRIAVRYYDNSKLDKQSGTAYFLLGYILQQAGKKDEEAMAADKKGADILGNTNEMKLNGLVNYNLGNLCLQNELYTQALKYLNKSLHYYRITKNKHDQASIYLLIANTYNCLNYKHDIIMYYSNIALKLSKSINDLSQQNEILSQQGVYCYNIDFAHSKELILKGYRTFPNNAPYYAAYLSYEYSMLNKPDSARYYLNIAFAENKNRNEKTLRFLTSAYVAKAEGNLDKAFKSLEKAYLIRDTLFQENLHNQLYRIDKQYDLTQREKENASLKISNQRKVIFISLLIIGILVLLFVISYVVNSHKKKLLLIDLENKIKQQSVEYELSKKKIENKQKQQLLLIKVQNRINNSILFNKLNMGLAQTDKKEEFTKLIVEQSTLSENDWQLYIDEVDQIFDKKIAGLLLEFPDLSKLDLIVITLICLQVNILDSCILLNMNKSTLYKRRNRIKERIGLSGETDLEEWLDKNIVRGFVIA